MPACCTMLCCAVRRCNRRPPITRRYASVIELFPYKVNRPLFANIIDKVPRTAMPPHKRATSIMQLTNAFFRFELSSQSTLRLWSRPRSSIPNRTKRTKSGTTSGKTGTSTRPHQRQTTRSSTVPQHTSESGSHSLQTVSVPPRPPTLQGGPGFVRLWSADLSGTVSHTKVRARACACACVSVRACVRGSVCVWVCVRACSRLRFASAHRRRK